MCDARGFCSLIGANFENDAAIQLNLALSRQEVKHQNNITTVSQLLFKIKHSVLTPAYKF